MTTALAFFEPLNELRIRIMHPLKAELSGSVIARDELEFLHGLVIRVESLRMA